MVGTTRSGRPLPEWKESSYGGTTTTRAADAPGANGGLQNKCTKIEEQTRDRLLSTSDDADEEYSVDLGGRSTHKIKITRILTQNTQ